MGSRYFSDQIIQFIAVAAERVSYIIDILLVDPPKVV